jgi:hypothetical protein
MNDENSASPDLANRPGKLRTWWHPLLVRLLNHLMATAYEVLDEVLVGRMPLRLRCEARIAARFCRTHCNKSISLSR